MPFVAPRRLASVAVLAVSLAVLCGCARPEVRPVLRGLSLPAVSESSLPQDEVRTMESLSLDELLLRGERSRQGGEPGLAQIYYSRALERAPDSPIAMTGLGEIALDGGEKKTADTLAREALRVQPDYVPALILLGRVLREQGEGEAALAQFDRALQIAPDHAGATHEVAMTWEGPLQQPAKAEPFYRRVAASAPDSAAAHNNLGFNLILQGRYAEAVAPLSTALGLDPKNRRIQGNLAAAWLLNGEEGRALQLFRKSVGEAQAYNNVGYLYMAQGKYSEAEAALRKALELSPRYYARAGENLELLREMKKRSGERPGGAAQR